MMLETYCERSGLKIHRYFKHRSISKSATGDVAPNVRICVEIRFASVLSTDDLPPTGNSTPPTRLNPANSVSPVNQPLKPNQPRIRSIIIIRSSRSTSVNAFARQRAAFPFPLLSLSCLRNRSDEASPRHQRSGNKPDNCERHKSIIVIPRQCAKTSVVKPHYGLCLVTKGL